MHRRQNKYANDYRNGVDCVNAEGKHIYGTQEKKSPRYEIQSQNYELKCQN